jgi:HlyD family secretion protein
MEKLYQEKVVSAEEYEKSQVALKQAKSEMTNSCDALNIVREGISLSNAKMSTTLVRSTVDGLILDIPVKVGNSVILSNSFNDGTTIATVADMQKLIFRGNIDETEVGRVIEGMPVTITVGAVQNLKIPARLEYISPKGRESNGANQFEIKAALAIPDTVALRSGYGANAEIVLDRVKKAVCVPEAALEFVGDSTYVYILTDSVPKQQFLRRKVETGLSNGIDIEVKSGVKVGEKVRGILKENEK